MPAARIIKQLVIVTPNEVGTLSKICAVVHQSGADIRHLCASALDREARFMLAVDKHVEAKRALEQAEYDVTEAEVIELDLENTPAALDPVARRLAKGAVDIEFNYATTGDGSLVRCILATNDNQRAVEIINSESES